MEWKRIRHIRWTDQYYADVKEYLLNGTISEEYQSVSSKKNFRKSAGLFTLDTANEIIFVTNEPPPWLKDDDGNAIAETRGGYRLRVCKESLIDSVLEANYSNPLSGCFRSGKSLHDKIKQECLGISREACVDFVNNRSTHQTNLPLPNIIVKPLITTRPFEQWECDLIEMDGLAGSNNKVNFLLCVIDIFSKFAYVRPIRNKTANLVVGAITDIIYQVGPPEKLSSDNGTEFKNKLNDAMCESFGIERIFSAPYKSDSNGAVERFNLTLKNAIFSYLTENKTKKYINVLQKIVYAYNTSIHSTTKVSPFLAHTGVNKQYKILNQFVAGRIQRNADKMVERSQIEARNMLETLIVDDKVRLSSLADKDVRRQVKLSGMRRSIQRWSSEVYTILDYEDGKYWISDDDGKLIGSYYRHELLKVVENEDEEVVNFEDQLENDEVNEALPLATIEEKVIESRLEQKDREEMKTVGEELKEEIQEIKDDIRESEQKILAQPDVFTPEAIHGEKTLNKKKYYLIKWLGYDSTENTWEPPKNLLGGAAALISAWKNSKQ